MSRNKNNIYNSNDNNLKDVHNHRLEKKETLIWTRKWTGLHEFLKCKDYRKNSLIRRPEEKKLTTMEYITPTMSHYPRNG